MAFSIALELGMTVGELRRRMSAREFAEWRAFFTWRGQAREAAARKSNRGGAPRGMGG